MERGAKLHSLSAGRRRPRERPVADPRRHCWLLSRESQTSNNRLPDSSMRINEALLTEFSEQDIAHLSRLLGKMLSNFANFPAEVTQP